MRMDSRVDHVAQSTQSRGTERCLERRICYEGRRVHFHALAGSQPYGPTARSAQSSQNYVQRQAGVAQGGAATGALRKELCGCVVLCLSSSHIDI